jgi:putative FmdB family regulatory protein
VPLYEYECDACGERFEVIRKFSDPPLEVCTKCGRGPIHRLPSSPAIQFKGTGWYITDYAQKGKSDKSAATGTKDSKKDAATTGGGDSSTTSATESTPSKTESSTTTSTPSSTPPRTGGTSKD